MRATPPEVLADLVDLLAACPAFEGVARPRLAELAGEAQVAYLARREQPVSPALVVMRGAVRLLACDAPEGGPVDDLVDVGDYAAPREGQCVEPVDSALVVWLPDAARAVAWSAARDAGWRPPAAATSRLDLQATPLRRVMSSPVLAVAASDTCRGTAARMRDARVSCVLVVPGGAGRAGILTDRDLRTRLVAEGRDADTPVAEVATFPALTVPAASTCFEALLEMLASGIHHLPVEEGGRVVGVVTSSDLQLLDSRSPLRVRTALGRAATVDDVRAALADLPGSVAAMLDAGTGPLEVGRVVATVTDQVHRTLLGLAFAEHGLEPSGRWGWLCFGSQARREQTLLTDQDTGLVVPDDDPAWADVARWVVDALEGCGYPRCRGGVMASEREWRHDLAGWHRELVGLVRAPSEEHLMAGSIAFDARGVAGPVGSAEVLGPALEAARGHRGFQGRLARVATTHRPPLGFLGRLTVERGGEHGGQMDLKKGALLPIADLARLFTLVRGGPEQGTDERLAAAAEAGVVSHDLTATLRAGYDLALGLRLRRHAQLAAAGERPSNHVDPGDLDPWVRAQLREAFKAVRLAQEHLATRYLTGLLG